MLLKLALNRIRLQKNKKRELNEVRRREIATLLADGKEDQARVKVKFKQRVRHTVVHALTQLCAGDCPGTRRSDGGSPRDRRSVLRDHWSALGHYRRANVRTHSWP